MVSLIEFLFYWRTASPMLLQSGFGKTPNHHQHHRHHRAQGLCVAGRIMWLTRRQSTSPSWLVAMSWACYCLRYDPLAKLGKLMNCSQQTMKPSDMTLQKSFKRAKQKNRDHWIFHSDRQLHWNIVFLVPAVYGEPEFTIPRPDLDKSGKYNNL